MVLVTGLILAVISAVVEFVWNARKTAARDKVSSFVLHFIRYLIPSWQLNYLKKQSLVGDKVTLDTFSYAT